jgi:hypothetical protein
MASRTAVTEYRRARRHKNAGQDNKKARRNKGTTPPFPIHTPEVDAKAPKAQVAPKKD